MSNQRSVMTEFRSLEQKRLTSGLTGEEELRLEELRELVGPEVAPPPRAGFDVGAAASRLRESLLPAGLRSRPLEMGPPPAPSPLPSEMFEPAPEPALESPWAAAEDATPDPAFEAAPEPEAWSAMPSDPPPGEVRPQAWNPEAPGYDPDAPFDEAAWIAAGYDPNVTYDWSVAGYELGDQAAAEGGEPLAAGASAPFDESQAAIAGEDALLQPPEAEAGGEAAAPGIDEAAPGWPEPGVPLVAEAGWPGAPEPLVEGVTAEADPLGGPVPLEVEEAPWLEEVAAAPAPEAPAPESDLTAEPWTGADPEATGLPEPVALAADDLVTDASGSQEAALPPPVPGQGDPVEGWADTPFAALPVHPEAAPPPAPALAPAVEPLPFDPDAPFDHAKWFGRREAPAAEPEVPAAWRSAAAAPVLEPEPELEPSLPEQAPAEEPQGAAPQWPEVGQQPQSAEPPFELEPTLELDLTRSALTSEPAWEAALEAEPPSQAPPFGDYDESGGALPRAFAMPPAEPDPAPAAPPDADPASAWFDETAAITGHLPAPPSAAFGEYDESAPATRLALDLDAPSFERAAPPAAPPPDLGEEMVEEGFEPGGPALDPAALAPLAPEPEEDLGQGHLYGGSETGDLPGGSPLDLGDPAAEWHPESALDAGFELASDGSFGHPDPAEAGTPAWSGPAAASPTSAEGWESAPALDLSAPFEGEPLAAVPLEEELPTLGADDLLELAPEPAAAELPSLELGSPPQAEPEPAWADAVAPELPAPELAPAWASEPEPVAPGFEATPAAWAAEASLPSEVEPVEAEAQAAAPSHEAGPELERSEPWAEAEPLDLAPQPAEPAPPTLAPAAPEEAAPPEPPPEAAPPHWEPEPAVSYEPPPPGLTLPPEIEAAYPDAPATGAFELPPALAGDLFDDLPTEAEPEASAAPAPQVRVEGSCRVVLHTVDGQVRRGLLCDTFLDAAALTLLPQGPGAPEEIPADGIKAIFFMLSPGEKAPPPDGRKVRVTFRDGRQVAGYSPDYREGSMGFFMIPADTRTNTGRIWVYQAAVRQVTVS